MSSSYEGHWLKTKKLTMTVLLIWALLSFVVHWFGPNLNTASFPGAYFMAGFGSQVCFAVLIFWYASRQDKIDEDYGLNEDSE